MATANPLHTGDDEYMYMHSDLDLGRGKWHRAYTVCKVSRGEDGRIVSLRFHSGPSTHLTILYVEKCFGPLVQRLVPIERSPDPARMNPAINRNLRRQVLAMRGIEDDSAAWLVGLRDAGQLTDLDVEWYLDSLAECPEGQNMHMHMIHLIIAKMAWGRGGVYSGDKPAPDSKVSPDPDYHDCPARRTDGAQACDVCGGGKRS